MKLKHSTIHKIVISLLVLIVILTVAVLLFIGYDYYSTSLEQRHFHPENQTLKASGFIGHGLGVVGSVLIIIGVFSYIIRKRIQKFSRVGLLKYWLEFHIFLCTLGPFLVLFHTTFKFGGIVSVSFWCMVAVFLSGIIGRFIYIQIPHTIEGRELSLLELEDLSREANKHLRTTITLDESIYDILNSSGEKSSSGLGNIFWKSREERVALRKLKKELKLQKVPKDKSIEITLLYKDQISQKKKIGRLVTMQNLFKYWHVAHLPFALVMLVIMVVHIVVVVTFGYKWIF